MYSRQARGKRRESGYATVESHQFKKEDSRGGIKELKTSQ